MPMTVQHVKNLTMADGTDSNVVRPSDWNSNHAVTYSPANSEIAPLFSNANGVSFGQSGTGITASIAAATAFILSASNGLAFGTNGSTVTGSYSQSTHSHSSVSFANANNVTLGLDAGTLTASASYPAQTAFVLSNSNGISFGTNGSTVTASHNGLTTAAQSNHSHGVTVNATNINFTTGGNSNGINLSLSAVVPAQTVQPVAVSGSNGSFNYSTLSFGNSNGISFYTTNGSVVASHTVPTVPSSYVSQVNGSSGAVSLAVGSSLSSSQNGSSITFGLASNITTALQSAGAYLTTAAQSNHSHGNPTLALTNISGTTASASNGFTLSLSAAAGGGGADGYNILAAGTQTATTAGSVKFENSNGITFGMSGSTQITASHNGLTTAAQSNHSHGVTVNATNINFTTGGNSNGINLSLSAVVPSQTVQPVAYSAANGSVAFSTITFANSNGVSFSSGTQGLYATVKTDYQSAGAYLTTARASNDAIGLNTAITQNGVSMTANSSGLSLNFPAFLTTAAPTNITTNNIATSQSSLFQHTSATTAIVSDRAYSTHSHGNPTLNLTNINGTTASASNGLTLSLSAVVPAQTNQTGNFYVAGNTTQLSSTAGIDLRSVSFEGAGVASIGVSNGRVLVSVPAGGGGGDGYNILGVNGGATALSTTLQLSNANNVSFGLNAGTITASASYPAQTAFVLSNSNNVSFGTNGSTVTATATFNQTVQTQGVSAIAGSGASTVSAGLVQFANGNGISFGLNGSTMTASHNALTTAMLSNANTGFLSTSQSSLFQHTSATSAITSNAAHSTHSHGNPTLNLTNLSGTTASASNGFTISLSAAAPGGGGAINVSAGTTSGNLQTLQFDNANGVSFGLNGSTLTASAAGGGGAAATHTMWFPFNEAVNVMGQQGQGTLHLVPVPTPDVAGGIVSFDRLCFPVLHSHATNSTGSVTLSQWFGLYTRGTGTQASRISLEHSTSFSTNYTFSGTANSSILSGMRLITIPWTSTINDNRYIVGVLSRTTTGGANCTVSQVLVSNLNSNFSGVLGQTTNRSYQWPLGWGQYSATTSALPASIAYSQINGTNSNAMRNPEWFMVYSTA